MPGSPPSRVTLPGTSPPPSTRSTSDTPVGTGRPSAERTAVMGTGATGGPERALTVGSTSSSSVRVFQSPHAVHLPDHLGAAAPQLMHLKTVRVLAMAGT